MRVVLGLLLVLLSLCGSGAQGEGGGLSEVGELSEFQKTDPRDAVEESSEQTTEQTYTDIWAEVRALRDMVVELKVELKNMESRLMDSESQVNELKAELIVTNVHVELLQRENSAQATELKSLETRLTATESKTSDLQEQNADLQARLSRSESELLVSKSRIDELKRQNAEKPKVAFHTALTYDGYVGPYNTDMTLKYNKVFTNIGNAYYPPTGAFTAPVRGVYYFQFTMFGNVSQASGVIVYANNQRIMCNVQRKQYDGRVEYFTNSVIFELDAGEKLYLVLPAGHSVYDNFDHHSTFSGALLFTL